MKTRTVFQRPATLAPGNQPGSSHCPTGHCFVSLWQICSQLMFSLYIPQAGCPPGLLYQQMIILFAPKPSFFPFLREISVFKFKPAFLKLIQGAHRYSPTLKYVFMNPSIRIVHSNGLFPSPTEKHALKAPGSHSTETESDFNSMLLELF